ncbi:MAG: hypothetical protein J5825_10335 [Lachnospiraceae bacterium]|nr:hypothetical protein [Lachnospiraceae bacterium]
MKKNVVFLIAGIISGFFAFPPGVISVTFLIIGFVFRAFPNSVHITVNGVQQQGAQAVASAIRLGNIFLAVGGGAIGLAFIFLLIAAVLLIAYHFSGPKAVPVAEDNMNGMY